MSFCHRNSKRSLTASSRAAAITISVVVESDSSGTAMTSLRCRSPHYGISELQEINMLNRKPLIIAAVAAAHGRTAISSPAYAHDDALLGALVGRASAPRLATFGACRRRATPWGSIFANSRSYYEPGTTPRPRPCTGLRRSTMAPRPPTTRLRRSTIAPAG
jgi:hypothetical protein